MMNQESRAGTAPTISVIVPAYQAAGFITETIDSILAQTFQDFEIIVVNDGSPDTEDLVKALAPYRDRIRYLRQDNQGPSGARNAGIRASSAEFIAPLDADDIWEPDHLEAQLEALRRDPSLDMIYADAKIFGDVPEAGVRLMSLSPSRGEVTFEALVRRDCVVHTCVCMIRRDALLRAGLFDSAVRRSEDMDTWLRLVLHGSRIGYQRRVLGRYRRRPGSQSSDLSAMIESYIGVLSKLADSPLVNSRQRDVAMRQMEIERAGLEAHKGKHAFLSGDSAAAIRHLSQSRTHYPSFRLAMIVLLLRIAPGFAGALYKWRVRARGE